MILIAKYIYQIYCFQSIISYTLNKKVYTYPLDCRFKRRVGGFFDFMVQVLQTSWIYKQAFAKEEKIQAPDIAQTKSVGSNALTGLLSIAI